MTKLSLPLPDLVPGQSTILAAGGRRFLVCRSAIGLHVMDEICPHQEKSLEGGKVRQGSIMCPHHGARFRLADGVSLTPALTTKSLDLVPHIVDGNQLEVDI